MTGDVRGMLRRFTQPVLIWLAAWGFLASAPSPAAAQIGRDSIPSTFYYNTFTTFFAGNYSAALANYQNELNSAIRNGPSNRWIDSICYYTMVGECYYQMGQHQRALENYNSAVSLYLANHNWMVSVQFPPGVNSGAAGSRVTVPWGQSKRGSGIASFPDSFPVTQGRINNNDVVQRGGVVTPPMIVAVNVSEIVRTTALAIRRRREILGPMSKHDPLTNELVTKLSARPGPVNHWAEGWLDVQLGAAYASVGNVAQAVGSLQRAVIVGGQFDHPLTSTALLELGRLALEGGNFDAASNYFEEATYSAVNFLDTGILEEAFRLGQMTHLLAGRKGVFPPLVSAIGWSRNGSRMLYCSLLVLAAENLAALNQAPNALQQINEARVQMPPRTDLANSALGARLNLVAATTAYQSGNVTDGDKLLAAAMAFQQNGSLWNFQINLADRLFLDPNGAFSERVGMLMYETLLRDPTPVDWATSPLESLSVMMIPHNGPLEHWFEAAQSRRNEQELALEIADRARRHRFYTTLPMGGRLMALRWLLEGPEELLTERAKLQKQDILSRYPKYATLSQEARRLRGELKQKPLVEETKEAQRVQSEQLAKFASLGQEQEVVLREIAVRREPADLVFPPVRKTKDLQAGLQPGQVLLSFFATSRSTYGFLFTRDRYTGWRVVAPVLLQKQLLGFLRELGHFEQNHAIGQAELTSGAWYKSTAKISDMLFDKSSVDLSAKFDELIVVPDASLWYLPFELLPIGKNDSRILFSQVRVRYAPTVGLGVPYSRMQKPQPNTGVVVGKLYPQDDDTVAQAAFERLTKSVPGAVALPSNLPAPTSVYRSLFDDLICLDDVESSEGGPYDWSPGQIDRGKAGSALTTWMTLPWGGPDRVMLPGFHSAAENSLKKAGANGSDLFLSIMGLMSTGARTVLISRWRPGGQTSFDLVREFAQEAPHMAPSDAWQRAVQLAASTPIEPDAEPRIKKLPVDAQPPRAGHPFFWSGFLLVDSGVMPEKPAEPVPPPVAQKIPPAVAPPANAQPAPNGLPGLKPPPALNNLPGLNGAPAANAANPGNAAQAPRK